MFAAEKLNDIGSVKYVQKIVPEATTPEHFKNNTIKNLRELVFDFLKNLSGKVVVNLDTQLPITISTSGCRKSSFGESMYYKKAAILTILPDIIKYAQFNNWGNKKQTDGPNIIGYLNFKCKCIIDGEKNCVRIAVQMQKGGKYYYNVEVNKKPTPGRSKA